MINTVKAILKETLGKLHIPALTQITYPPLPVDIEETFITDHRMCAAQLVGDKNPQCTVYKTHNLFVSCNTVFHTLTCSTLKIMG